MIGWVINLIHIEAMDNNIWISGRNPDKTRYQKTVPFRPYFYALSDIPTDTKSISGEYVKRIECDHPGQVPTLKKEYTKTFESDIPYVVRYMCDRMGKIEKEPLRVCFLDIETQTIDKKFPDVKKATNQIYSISLYDNFIKKYFIFNWKKGQKEEKISKGEDVFFNFSEETPMLLKFISYVKQNDPDILTAFYGDAFDFPYILNRLKVLGIKPELLSPLGELDEDKWKGTTRLRGREMFDFYWGYRKLSKGEKESNSLDYMGFSELGLPKVKYEGTLDELRERDYPKFLEYNKRDVEIMVEVDKKLGIIDFHDSLRRLAKTPWYSGFTTIRMADSYCLNYCHGKFVLPEAKSGKKEKKFKGATVFEPKKGLNKNVIASDMKSLYPSIIISLNMSPETLSEDGENHSITGAKFKAEPKGLMSGILEKLFTQRQKVKKKMKEFEFGTEEYDRYYKEQYALKELMNSFYGVLGNASFRLYKYEIAETIAAMAREVLSHIKKNLEFQGCEVVYGDTDSAYFTMKDDKNIVKDGEKIIETVNESFNEFGKKWNLKKHILKLQFERVFKTLIFLENTKKRYAGIVSYEDGKEADYVKVVGFEAIRSDTPYISRKFQKEFLILLLKEKPKKEIIIHVQKFYNKIIEKEFKAEDMGMPKGLSKDPMKYGGFRDDGSKIMLPIYARASLYSNKFNKTNIMKGSKIKMMYVTSVPPNQPHTEIIAIEETMPKGYTIDYNTMAQKICIDKVKRFFSNMNWSVSEVYGQNQLNKWM